MIFTVSKIEDYHIGVFRTPLFDCTVEGVIVEVLLEPL